MKKVLNPTGEIMFQIQFFQVGEGWQVHKQFKSWELAKQELALLSILPLWHEIPLRIKKVINEIKTQK